MSQATTLFDPVNATHSDWVSFFADVKNCTKDHKNPRNTDQTPCMRMYAQIAESDVPLAERELIARTIADALKFCWKEFFYYSHINAFMRGQKHPVTDIMKIIEVNGRPHRKLISCIHSLWNCELSPVEQRILMGAFGKYCPMTNDELATLYGQDLKGFGVSVLTVLLKKGEIELANKLFVERVSELFVDVDPIHLDPLVQLGLTFESAMIWLNQSKDRKQANDGFAPAIETCEKAEACWRKLAES